MDHWTDTYDGDHTWIVNSRGSKLTHYAMWPAHLAERLILSMCPPQVCTTCGEPRRRIQRNVTQDYRTNAVDPATFSRWLSDAMKDRGVNHRELAAMLGVNESMVRHYLGKTGKQNHQIPSIEAFKQLSALLTFSNECSDAMRVATRLIDPLDRGNRQVDGRLSGGPLKGDDAKVRTLGWSDCGHGAWRNGHVLDPFAGTSTTLCVAELHGRDATGIDIDPTNRELMPKRMAEVKQALTGEQPQVAGQLGLFGA